jgi:hypothetical protein
MTHKRKFNQAFRQGFKRIGAAAAAGFGVRAFKRQKMSQSTKASTRRRGGGSKTRVRPALKLKLKNESQDIGGISSFAKHKLGPARTPKFEKMGAPCNIQLNASQEISINAGSQNWMDFVAGWAEGNSAYGNYTGDLGYLLAAVSSQRTTQFAGTLNAV